MILSVSKDGIEWSLDFGPDLVTLTVNDRGDKTTITSREIPLAARSLLLSQRQNFLKNHVVTSRVANTPNQEGTMEMRDEVFSNVGRQDVDTSGYQVFDLDDVEFYWENDQLYADAVFRPGNDLSFSPLKFNDFEKGFSG